MRSERFEQAEVVLIERLESFVPVEADERAEHAVTTREWNDDGILEFSEQ
jgi:hypothetical protein